MMDVFWIENDPPILQGTASFLFPKLWEKGYTNRILLMGDSYQFGRQENRMPQKEIDLLYESVYQIFIAYCAEKAGDTGKTPKQVSIQLQHLRPKKPDYLRGKPEEVFEKIKNIITAPAFICLDLQLFENDSTLKEETLAMKLLYHFYTKGQENNKSEIVVIPYTSFDVVSDRNEWRKKFKEYHEDYTEDIKIFSRQQLTQKIHRDGDELKYFLEIFPKIEKGEVSS